MLTPAPQNTLQCNLSRQSPSQHATEQQTAKSDHLKTDNREHTKAN